MMWRHRSPPTYYSSHQAIGKPILHDTTYDEKLLETLPHVREALLLKRRAHDNKSTQQQSPSPASPSPSPANNAHRRDKRFSDVPTASSVYTQSPEFSYQFDESSKVAPLFADRQTTAPLQLKMNIVSKRRLSSIPVPVKQDKSSPPTDGRTGHKVISKLLPGRAQKSALPGLGIHTLPTPKDAHEWQGASGGTALLTPITDTPVQSERTQSPSVSPVSEYRHVSAGPALSDIDDAAYVPRRPPPPPVPLKSEHDRTQTSVFDARTDKGTQPMQDVFRPAGPSLELAAEPLKSRFSWTTKADSELPTTPEMGVRPSLDASWGPSPAQEAAEHQQQPGSRFSWTTIATTVPATSSPPRLPTKKPQHQDASWSTIASTVKASPHQVRSQTEPQPSVRPTEQKNRYVFEEDTPPLLQQSWTWGSAPPTYPPNNPHSSSETPETHKERLPMHHHREQALSSPPDPNLSQSHTSPPHSHSPTTALRNPRLRPQALDIEGAHSSPITQARATPVRRKPTPSMLHTTPGATALHDAAPATPSDPDKDLPPAPPALDSMDLLTSLEAELESLANRRANLTKLIAALTSLDPLSPISPAGAHRAFADIAAVDLAKRRADRERARTFEAELADVKMREHAVGLRLLKAWKRREENVEAPSALWVRRTTK